MLPIVPGGIAVWPVVLVILIVIWLVPAFFFVRTLHRAFARCSSQCRTMSPGLVWLLFVPFFNSLWSFWVVNALSNSLHREFTQRGIAAEQRPGRDLGFWCTILVVVAKGLSKIPFVGALASAAALVCWIQYRVRIHGYSAMIAEPFTPPES